jgi:signal transduction histidine kinase
VIGQKSKVEAINAQLLLDMKRTFVRYVSHEIRTPLNTVSMGLKLIQDLKQRQEEKKARKLEAIAEGNHAAKEEAGSEDEDIFEMTDEIKESCDIAINILNDLLLYEKMEGGLLELDKQKEPALSLVYEVRSRSHCTLFRCQV